MDVEAPSSLLVFSRCSSSNALKEFRKKFFGIADSPALGMRHSCRQHGQLNLSPCLEAVTWLSKQPLQRVWRHGKMRGSVKSPRQMGHSSKLSTVPGCLLAMVLVVGFCDRLAGGNLEEK